MNVDILKDNPSFMTYIYFAVPTFVLVMLSVLLLKFRPQIRQFLRSSSRRRPFSNRLYSSRRRGDGLDIMEEEMELSTPLTITAKLAASLKNRDDLNRLL